MTDSKARFVAFATLTLLAAVGVVAQPAAAIGTEGCTVSSSTESEHSCEFVCSGPGKIFVTASASSGKITVNGGCGSAAAGCTSTGDPCGDSDDVVSPSDGKCVLDDHIVGKGMGGCSFEPEAPACDAETLLEQVLCYVVGPPPTTGPSAGEVSGCDALELRWNVGDGPRAPPPVPVIIVPHNVLGCEEG